MLDNLLDQLKGYDIIVFDDCSDNLTMRSDIKYVVFQENYGKKNAWIKFDKIFNELSKKDYDYFFMIPDDIVLCKDFINKSIKLFDNIVDNRKISLSLLSDERVKHPNWTNAKPLDKGDVILTGWNDLLFVSTKEFFEVVDSVEVPKDRWDGNESLGSGVGSVLSKQLYKKNYNMYHSKESLCTHGGHLSKMNRI
jgi:hypothetical protein|tara:strand:- start:1698 stop:2282 length:585 start_codon:yes stop_codon:yes gene_type:complete